MFYSSAPCSEKQDRTTVPRTCSTGARQDHCPQNMFYRSKTGPQSPEHVLQKQDRTTVPRTCSTGARQDHSPQNMFYNSAPASEKQEQDHSPKSMLYRCKTGRQFPEYVLQKTGPQSQEYILQFCPLFREARRQQWQHGRPYVRIICKCSESAQDRRIAIYKSNQQQQPS